MIEGVLLVNKPVGWTSFDAVNYLRSIITRHYGIKPKQLKIGHTGTLDPFAEGLLVILIGKNYTKKMPFFLKLDKSYQATMKLGEISDTGDNEGKIIFKSDLKPTTVSLENVLKKFIGEITQKPPIYSAIKINGQRAYSMARNGDIPEMPVRTIQIKSLVLDSYHYPEAVLSVLVSSGTYIRSLVEDIGATLDVGAYTKSLVRRTVGDYSLDHAVSLDKINFTKIERSLIKI